MLDPEKEERVVLANKVFEFEKAIFEARQNAHSANMKVELAQHTYQTSLAKILVCDQKDLEFSNTICFGTRLISYCVWDLRKNASWPFCVFCGAPKYED